MDTEQETHLLKQFEFLSKRPSADHSAYNCPADKLIEFSEHLLSKEGYDILKDVTAVDWLGEKVRFTVMYHVFSSTTYDYIRIAVDCLDNENPEVPSVVSLWAAADWHERETFDMFGIKFKNHPNLKRILMWDEYEYHPLRKVFPLAGIDCEFPGEDVADRVDVEVLSAPMMGGPFVSSCSGTSKKREPSAADQSWTEEKSK